MNVKRHCCTCCADCIKENFRSESICWSSPPFTWTLFILLWNSDMVSETASFLLVFFFPINLSGKKNLYILPFGLPLTRLFLSFKCSNEQFVTAVLPLLAWLQLMLYNSVFLLFCFLGLPWQITSMQRWPPGIPQAELSQKSWNRTAHRPKEDAQIIRFIKSQSSKREEMGYVPTLSSGCKWEGAHYKNPQLRNVRTSLFPFPRLLHGQGTGWCLSKDVWDRGSWGQWDKLTLLKRSSGQDASCRCSLPNSLPTAHRYYQQVLGKAIWVQKRTLGG